MITVKETSQQKDQKEIYQKFNVLIINLRMSAYCYLFSCIFYISHNLHKYIYNQQTKILKAYRVHIICFSLCAPSPDTVTFLKKYLFLIYLFIYLWLYWVSVAARGLSVVAASGGYSSLRCADFSLQCLLLLRSMGSRHMGFSSRGMRAQQLWLMGSGAKAEQLWCTGSVAPCMWDLPGSGLEPVSPSLTGRFLTTVPPGKSDCHILITFFLQERNVYARN